MNTKKMLILTYKTFEGSFKDLQALTADWLFLF